MKHCPVEVHHQDRSTTVVARVPGARADTLRVDLERDRVVIEAEAHGRTERLEVPLAARVDDRRAEMHFADGVLWLFLPQER